VVRLGAYDLVTPQVSTITGTRAGSARFIRRHRRPNGDYSGWNRQRLKYAFGLIPRCATRPAPFRPVYSGSSLTLSYTAPAGAVGVTYGASGRPTLSRGMRSRYRQGNTHIFTVSTVGQSRMFIRNEITIAP